MASALNIILMGIAVVSVIPLVKSFLPIPKEPATHVVRIGFGGLNVSIEALDGLGGRVPAVALYDVRGDPVGDADTGDLLAPAGGFGERKIISTVTPDRKTDGIPSRAGVSWKRTDFAPLDKEVGLGLATQWRLDSATLCRAPARQQFWKTVVQPDSCIPIYDRLLELNEDGTDADRDYIINGNVQRCIATGQVDNNVSLYLVDGRRIIDPQAPFMPDLRFQQPKPPAIPPGLELSDSVDLGTLGKRQDGRVFPRASHRDHGKCENELVISEVEGISAKEVCESENSWGLDIVSLKEGLYCDM
ncbi:uncharacterized protein DNG_09696 [Cephalotrichum gorgonifer]|uniref:Uncharacterized protein n=1 Tax=Cephalotrichum gorgonifer TaxID=2041049 RepID=A0AAE8N8I9_9PEZI|nr:uncharacterized protein DNG_09696 [Cephalotrichum gorgonifer]